MRKNGPEYSARFPFSCRKQTPELAFLLALSNGRSESNEEVGKVTDRGGETGVLASKGGTYVALKQGFEELLQKRMYGHHNNANTIP
jgi:hypothetical protein